MKSFEIRKRLVYEAWMKVQANDGAPGVDTVSIEGAADFRNSPGSINEIPQVTAR
jgi:hypothetical protein